MGVEKVSEVVKEADKPFILALIASGLTVGEVVALCYAAVIGLKDAAAAIFDVLKFTFPLTATAWGFYFANKKGE
jgi:hypothetical protein